MCGGALWIFLWGIFCLGQVRCQQLLSQTGHVKIGIHNSRAAGFYFENIVEEWA